MFYVSRKFIHYMYKRNMHDIMHIDPEKHYRGARHTAAAAAVARLPR